MRVVATPDPAPGPTRFCANAKTVRLAFVAMTDGQPCVVVWDPCPGPKQPPLWYHTAVVVWYGGTSVINFHHPTALPPFSVAIECRTSRWAKHQATARNKQHRHSNRIIHWPVHPTASPWSCLLYKPTETSQKQQSVEDFVPHTFFGRYWDSAHWLLVWSLVTACD